MDKSREFQGRDLDDCIAQAMTWYDCPRENLEIEILQDAKTGIFGIVGARKAKICARRAHVEETVRNFLENPDTGKKAKNSAKKDIKKTEVARDQSAGQRLPKKKINEPEEIDISENLEEDDEFEDQDLANIDQERLKSEAKAITRNLVRPIAERDVDVSVEFTHGRPRIRIEWEGDAGLLIGREGQTLIALQYLVSRILSRAMNTPLRVQLDIGQYRTRQDDKLRELARSLAEKVRKTGRPLSTRPLSSYHRRVIHIFLQGYPDIQTRSAGEGTLKRVLISPRRS